jgi:hypothetical protein
MRHTERFGGNSRRPNMTNFDSKIADALGREVPLRAELEPGWSDVVARAQQQRSALRWRPRRRILASRWALVGALIAAAGLSIGGLAIADSFGPLRGAKIDVNPTTVGGPGGISSCGLIGKPADQDASPLAGKGIGIEWRFTHWGTAIAAAVNDPVPTTPREQAEASAQGAAQSVGQAQAETGGSSDAVSSVPDDSIVWDVVPDGQTKAFVFVEAPNDPNAPTVSTGSCSN